MRDGRIGEVRWARRGRGRREREGERQGERQGGHEAVELWWWVCGSKFAATQTRAP